MAGLPGTASIYSLKWWIVDGHGYERCGCWHDLIKTAEWGEEEIQEVQAAEAECLFSILTLITREEKLQFWRQQAPALASTISVLLARSLVSGQWSLPLQLEMLLAH